MGRRHQLLRVLSFLPVPNFVDRIRCREPHVEPPTPPTPGESGDGTINVLPQHPPYHPVTAMYQVNMGGKMKHVSTMLSGDDDVNIARFHPDSGYGFVYGTKQGRIRVLGPRPWNYYNC
jgi:hypothetical protein